MSRVRGVQGQAMGKTSSPEGLADPAVEHALALLGERGVLAIIHLLTIGPAGFNEVARRTALSPATLAQRLALLEREGVLAKRTISTMPPRGEYSLTLAGADLAPVVKAIETWAHRRIAAR
jgi:DNA-binding HxlR family transcriptional regulator